MPIEIEIDGKKVEVDDKIAEHFQSKYENNPALFDKASKTVAKNILDKLSPEIRELLGDKVKPGMKGKDIGELLSNSFLEELEKSKDNTRSKTDEENKNDFQKQLDEIKRAQAEELAKIKSESDASRIRDKISSFKEKLKAKAIKSNLRPENEEIYESALDRFFKFELENGKIQTRKSDGELFFNKDGKDPSDEDIVDFLKDKFPGLHTSQTLGAGIGPGGEGPRNPGSGNNIDLNKSAKQLISEGYDELPKIEGLGKSI